MITFKLFAGTDVGLRDNNEDNFTVNPDLTLDKWMVPANQQVTIPLGKWGCLMVVADGMGGMNAGEVASDIAIKTVQDMFSLSKFPANVVNKPDNIKKYIKKVIDQADRQVKQHCKEDPSTEGMGSTIVIAWLVDGYAYIGWMGDSRAYSFVPEKGITRLSKDHSFVQGLVDAKMLTEEEAMFHPQSNVIMRSLGDMTQKAKPDVVCHRVEKGEIILLCSDGLCGVCEDDSIAEILNKTSEDLKICKEALTNAALEAEGSDNITIALLQIVENDSQPDAKTAKQTNIEQFHWQNLLVGVFALFVISSLLFAGLKSCEMRCSSNSNSSDSAKTDTVTDDSIVKYNGPIDSVGVGQDSILGDSILKDIVKPEKGQILSGSKGKFSKLLKNPPPNDQNNNSTKNDDIVLTPSKGGFTVDTSTIKQPDN
jgi:protein phosphatase